MGIAEPGAAAEHRQETGQATLPVDDEFVVLVEVLTRGCRRLDPSFAQV